MTVDVILGQARMNDSATVRTSYQQNHPKFQQRNVDFLGRLHIKMLQIYLINH